MFQLFLSEQNLVGLAWKITYSAISSVKKEKKHWSLLAHDCCNPKQAKGFFSHFPSDLRDDRGYVADNMGYNFITTAQVKGNDIYIIK